MFVYKIENLINGKKYIGITNDVSKRWSNHRCNSDQSAIGYAIQKYGEENFDFAILHKGLTIEQAEEKEVELIQEYKTLTTQHGYNVLCGGIGTYAQRFRTGKGLGNANQKLTEEEVRYIKDHRNLPLYRLYDDFTDKISYDHFKKIYHNRAFLEVEPSVECYEFNFEYSNQFTNQNSVFTPLEIEAIRVAYAEGKHWKDVYKNFSDRCTAEHFWKIYTGRVYKYVMPGVFTPENHKKHSSKRNVGSRNPRSKLTEDQVLDIRRLAAEGVTPKEIHEQYSIVSLTSIRDVINRKTWKHLQ